MSQRNPEAPAPALVAGYAYVSLIRNTPGDLAAIDASPVPKWIHAETSLLIERRTKTQDITFYRLL
jgi:hypothetical protein